MKREITLKGIFLISFAVCGIACGICQIIVELDIWWLDMLLILFVFSIFIMSDKIMKKSKNTESVSGGLKFERIGYKKCAVIGTDAYVPDYVIIPEKSPNGDNVIKIERLAFSNYDRLVSIEIPNNVTNIGMLVFTGCDSLTSIEVSKDNPTYKFEGTRLIDKRTGEVIFEVKYN